MYDTKLISARVDKETLAKIDKFCTAHPYWRRNLMINRILMAVMADFDEAAIYDMVRRRTDSSVSVDAKYERKSMYPIKQ